MNDALVKAVALEISNAIADQLAHRAQTTEVLEERARRIIDLVRAGDRPRVDVPAIEADKRTR